ncbi:MAG: SMC-Scp complex subunit ScpB [Candidatus Pacebacteria bacterium]|nr:SMC-Scp complex subunit ScpB [Candidatus Paceibacterota bacterium]
MENDIKSFLESLIFVSGEPMGFSKLAKIMDVGEEDVHAAAENLAEDYQNRAGGLRVIIQNGKVQMVTAAENSEVIERLMKIDIEGDLSRSALETISIVAYRGPISRSDIEEIRGVNTSFTLRQLAIRGLVEKIDNPNDARAYLYRMSFDFLRHLGVEKVEDLPKYRELREKELISEQIIENDTEGLSEDISAGKMEGEENSFIANQGN